MAGTIDRADFVINSEITIDPIEVTVQRAVDFAMRRASHIDRTADLLLSIGRTDAAERLAHIAAEIRAEAA